MYFPNKTVILTKKPQKNDFDSYILVVDEELRLFMQFLFYFWFFHGKINTITFDKFKFLIILSIK